MRSIFLLLLSSIFFFGGGAALAQNQINPGNQIKWPMPNCTTGVYQPSTNTCVATGGAANPAGQPGQKQINGGGTFGVIPNTFVANASGVQACINAAGNNGVCELPPNYTQALGATLTISLSNFTLQCDTGAALTTAGIDAIHVTGGSNVTILGCILDGTSTGSGNGIIMNGTNNFNLLNNTIENFGARGLYAANGTGGIEQGNILLNNGSDGLYHENVSSYQTIGNTITSATTTFIHSIAFHSSYAADTAAFSASCSMQTATAATIVGNGTTATFTATAALPALFGTLGVTNITGTTGSPNFNGVHLITVTGANTFTFASSTNATVNVGTATTGTVLTAPTITSGGHNYPATGNLTFLNGQVTAGSITANVPTATYAATGGVITSATLTNGGYCNTTSSPIAVHVSTSTTMPNIGNSDIVQNIEVAGNIINQGDAFAVEVGSFGGAAGLNINVHDNHATKTLNTAGDGGYSFDTDVSPKMVGNSYSDTQAIAPDLPCGEIVNSPGAITDHNTFQGCGISQNKSSFGVVSNNTIKDLYTGLGGIFNGTSDYSEPFNQSNTISGNTISFQPGAVPAFGIETQCNSLNCNTSGTVITGNTINVPSGAASGNAIIFSDSGVNGAVNTNSSHQIAANNIIGPWRHAYSTSTTASGSLNLNDDSQAVDLGTIQTSFVYFGSAANQTAVRTIAFDGSSASAISNLFMLSMVSQSVGGIFNVAPSSAFSGELMQATIDNIIMQAGNGSNPRSIFMCGSSDTGTTNCPSFFNDALVFPAGNINMPANGTNGYCFMGTGACFTWNATLSAVRNDFAIEAQNNVYILQSASGFWNRFTQLGTLAVNSSVNLPAANSATVPSLTQSIANCADGFSSTTASWSTAPCLPLYTPAGTLQTGTVHSVNITGTYSGGTLAITFAGSAVFTSATSYACSVDNSTAPPTYTSGTSVTFNGSSGNAVRGICVGN